MAKQMSGTEIVGKLRQADVQLAQGKTVPEVCRELGINRTAKTLRLDYSMLKKRLASTASDTPPDVPTGSDFLELLPTGVTAAECVLECQDARGTKLRLHFKGPQLPDLAALSRALWNGQS